MATQIVKDEGLSRAGFDPIITNLDPTTNKPVCSWCNKAITLPPLEHAVSCCREFTNSLVGNQVEKEVVNAIAKLTPIIARHPELNQQLEMHLRTDQRVFSDFTIRENGRNVFVDVTFASSYTKTETARDIVNPTLEASIRQQDKVKKYGKNVRAPEGSLLNIALDSCGAMSDDGKRLITRLAENKRKDNATVGTTVSPQRNYALRNVRESISFAVCNANAIYMSVLRTGKLPNGSNRTEAKAQVQERKRNQTTTTTTNTAQTMEAELIAELERAERPPASGATTTTSSAASVQATSSASFSEVGTERRRRAPGRRTAVRTTTSTTLTEGQRSSSGEV
jgi:hypothetical protein